MNYTKPFQPTVRNIHLFIAHIEYALLNQAPGYIGSFLNPSLSFILSFPTPKECNLPYINNYG